MKILDATCGHRSMWFEKHNKYTTYMDIRESVRPDIVSSASQTPFADHTFDIILFDPPHKNMGKKPHTSKKRDEMTERYGSLNAQERTDLVKNAFVEFYRILKDDGLVFFKWHNCGTATSKIIKLRGNFQVIFAQNFNKIKTFETSWFCLRKDMNIQKTF